METFIFFYCFILFGGVIVLAIFYSLEDIKLITALAILGALVLSPITISIIVILSAVLGIISIPVFCYKSVILCIKIYKNSKNKIDKIVSDLEKEIEDLI